MDNQKPPETGRLAVLDEYGSRRFVIPAEVRGYFATWKKRLHWVLLLIFLILPWAKMNGEQLVLLDIPNRHFVLFGLGFYSHDAPLIFFILILAVLILALMTALFGRVWCGWACPQTVFIERIYRAIEILTEGNYLERRKLLQSGTFSEKLRKSGLKWVLYFLVSSLIAHSFVAYWTGSDVLLEMMKGTPKQNWSYFLLVSSMTGLLLFNFGWFREQFCLIMCPYGKFQAVLMDSQTINVMYDEKRGEPRKSSMQKLSNEKAGDCVSCQRCVQVCPTGIDIRQGVQMECIGCTACIDACDEIMVKVKKPTGLIRYKAMTDQAVNFFRPRVLIYSGFIIAFSFLFGMALLAHSNLRIQISRAQDNPYAIRLVDGKKVVQNHFKIILENDSPNVESFLISTNGLGRLILPENPIVVARDKKRELPLFIELPIQEIDQEGRGEVILKIVTTLKIQEKKLTILGPNQEVQSE